MKITNEVYFLHGLGQSQKSWDKVIENVTSIDVECLNLLDMGSTYSVIFKTLENYLSQIDEPLYICGLSLGAILALNYAFLHNTHVASLIVIGSQYKIPTLLIDFQNLIFKCLPNNFFVKSNLSKKQMISLTKSMRTLNFIDNLQNIHCPVAIVCGEKDFPNLKASQNLHKQLLKSMLYIIPQCGHEVNREQPKKIAMIIKEHWGI